MDKFTFSEEPIDYKASFYNFLLELECNDVETFINLANIENSRNFAKEIKTAIRKLSKRNQAQELLINQLSKELIQCKP